MMKPKEKHAGSITGRVSRVKANDRRSNFLEKALITPANAQNGHHHHHFLSTSAARKPLRIMPLKVLGIIKPHILHIMCRWEHFLIGRSCGVL